MNWSKVNSTVRELYRRNGRDQMVHRVSLAEILARDPMPDVDAMTDEQLREYADEDCLAVPKGACREEVIELIREHKDKLWHARGRGAADLLELIARDGPHPLSILRNFYAYAKAIRPSCVMNASLAQLAVLGDDGKGARGSDGRATVSDRIKRLVELPIRKSGMRGFKAAFQKTETACANYSESARENKNRLGSDYLRLNGKKKAA